MTPHDQIRVKLGQLERASIRIEREGDQLLHEALQLELDLLFYGLIIDHDLDKPFLIAGKIYQLSYEPEPDLDAVQGVIRLQRVDGGDYSGQSWRKPSNPELILTGSYSPRSAADGKDGK